MLHTLVHDDLVPTHLHERITDPLAATNAHTPNVAPRTYQPTLQASVDFRGNQDHDAEPPMQASATSTPTNSI